MHDDLPYIVLDGLLKLFKADAKNTFASDPPAGYFFFLISPAWEANFGEKTFFLSSLQTSLGLPVTSFLKKWAIYNKTITLNLEHTFFLREPFIYNDFSDHFSLSNAIN